MKKLITLLFALMLATMLSANNIAVTNIKLTGQNTGSGYAYVQFDISWDNSWRTASAPYNWDAAWVFVKYRVKTANGGDGLWRHAWLNSDGHTAPSGSAIDVGFLDPATAFNTSTNPGLGAFVYRDAAGTGAFSKTGLQFRWNYGVNFKTGTTPIGDNDAMDVQVFAVEMVYVPAGSFYLGSGANNPLEAWSFTAANNTAGATVPFQITATAPTLQGNDAGSSALNLSARGAWAWDLTGTTTATFATGYPTGYGAFYCMKYEICQQDYVDFLNNLSQTQATVRYPGQSTKRHGITVAANVYNTSQPFVACNFLSWADVAGYLDWSGMRPMTELEFEKACRGTLAPVPSEYAWGTVNIAASTYTLSGAGATGEVIASNYSLTAGNVANSVTVPFSGAIDGPLRVGIFAGTSGNTGRVTSGATYYGIMEMSGNLYERTVTAGNATGRLFTGTHGNGDLNVNGDADALTWPAGSDAIGAGFRGGCWGFDPQYLLVSERANAAYPIFARESYYGGRGVRSPNFYIGQSYGGGIIFYIDGTGQHGLIASTADQSTGIQWAVPAYQTTSVAGTSTAMRTGSANTDKIIAQNGAGSTYAAGLARAYTGGGYIDWFLPSKDELNQMYLQTTVIGGFVSAFYWSSSEYNASYAWVQYLSGGFQTNGPKGNTYYVRAVRAF